MEEEGANGGKNTPELKRGTCLEVLEKKMKKSEGDAGGMEQ